MPVAAPSTKETPPLSTRLRQFIPKPPPGSGYGSEVAIAHEGLAPGPTVTTAGAHYTTAGDSDRTTYITADLAEAYVSHLNAGTNNSPIHDACIEDTNYFNTHSPPILNLSPNLSPSSEPQRNSPIYDLRESTRRRSVQGLSFKNVY